MDIATLKQFFMWCTILNGAMLLLPFSVMVFAGDFVYRVHGRLFPMPRERFNAALYTLIGVYKIVVIAFNAVPWIALVIIG